MISVSTRLRRKVTTYKGKFCIFLRRFAVRLLFFSKFIRELARKAERKRRSVPQVVHYMTTTVKWFAAARIQNIRWYTTQWYWSPYRSDPSVSFEKKRKNSEQARNMRLFQFFFFSFNLFNRDHPCNLMLQLQWIEIQNVNFFFWQFFIPQRMNAFFFPWV